MKLSRAIQGAVMGLALWAATAVQAEPILQIYIEGATYDEDTDTWVGDFMDGDTLRVWAIGNISGGGGKGTISDVKLSIAYSSADSPTISVSESTTGGYGGFTDPSTANTATFVQTVTDGSSPQLSDGSDLPSHGIYGAGTSWDEYDLGDFSVADSPGGDFISSLPTPVDPDSYSINVYEITISGTGLVHFDLYDNIVAGMHAQAKFAPFSHDGEGGGNGVPDGGTSMALLGLALVGIEALRRRHA